MLAGNEFLMSLEELTNCNQGMSGYYNYINTELALAAPCILESCSKIKRNLNFYFHPSSWCLKRFYEGL